MSPFTGLASLSVVGLPVGVTAQFTPAATISLAQTGTLTLNATATAAPGNYNLTVKADTSEGGVPRSKIVPLTLTVQSSAGVAGVKGRFVTPEGAGIAGVIVRADINPTTQLQTTTDASGNFTLTGLPPGLVTLRLDATPANPLYPIWPYTVPITAAQLNVLPE